MLTPELEQLVDVALADGVITDKERSVLMRKAQEAGIDPDEFEMILDAKLHNLKKKEAEAVPAPKPNAKYGEVRKCPGCGAMVSAFTTTCPECGFEFNNVEAVKSANTLFEKLQALEMEKARELAKHDEEKSRQLQALSKKHNGGGALRQFANSFNTERQDRERDDLVRVLEKGDKLIERKYLDAKINLIKVYAVPNTKGDLLELLSMATSSAYDNDGVIGPEEEVWLQKADQIYQKLVICAAGDNVTLNQATNMLVSLIKRLPKEYKNFTRIPKELRDKINVELKAQKAEKNAEFKDTVINILKGWRGISLGISILLFLFSLLLDKYTAFGSFMRTVGMIAVVVAIAAGYFTWKAIKNAKEDLLY